MKEQALDALRRAGLAAAAAPAVEKDLETGRLVPRRALEQHTAPLRWTLKRLVTWIETQFGHQVSRETLRQALKRLGFSCISTTTARWRSGTFHAATPSTH
ncbi:winged helix-turn-helix domain-containing protein [uncultured Thiodictyon sp.]|uniref:helix-turn-helix domain-containing protein n=1 Tax=uncultured Thiodictyon sp. TaxID=1846217 RepID=UPI0034365428